MEFGVALEQQVIFTRFREGFEFTLKRSHSCSRLPRINTFTSTSARRALVNSNIVPSLVACKLPSSQISRDGTEICTVIIAAGVPDIRAFRRSDHGFGQFLEFRCISPSIACRASVRSLPKYSDSPRLDPRYAYRFLSCLQGVLLHWHILRSQSHR